MSHDEPQWTDLQCLLQLLLHVPVGTADTESSDKCRML